MFDFVTFTYCFGLFLLETIANHITSQSRHQFSDHSSHSVSASLLSFKFTFVTRIQFEIRFVTLIFALKT